MRTKTLLLTAVLSAAGVASSLAQTYSVNTVGYVNMPFPVGFSLVGNPLNSTDNTIANLFPNVPNFSNIYKWNGTGFDIATFTFGVWDKPTITVNPGEGIFVNTDTAFTNTFVGDVKQGSLSTPIPAGFSIVSSQVPQSGDVTTLGLTTLGTFDNLYKWTGTSYQIYTVLPGGTWDPSTPSLNVGEAVFINANAATSWNRTFSTNP